MCRNFSLFLYFLDIISIKFKEPLDTKNTYTHRNLTNIHKLLYATYGTPENSCSWAGESPIKKPCETGAR